MASRRERLAGHVSEEGEGGQAFLDGATSSENPYPKGTSDHEEWLRSWELEAMHRAESFQPDDLDLE